MASEWFSMFSEKYWNANLNQMDTVQEENLAVQVSEQMPSQ